MQLPKILIADPSDDLRYLLADILQGYGDIMTAASGPEALRLLGIFRPDVLILDMMLPGLDGISLLYQASSHRQLPAVLALTTFTSDYLLHSFGRIGVDYAMLKPFDTDALVCRVLDLVKKPAVSPLEPLTDTLLRLGIHPNRRGYLYLTTAVNLIQKNPNQAVTKELYPAIAHLHGASAPQVERDIRVLIHTAWERRQDATWRTCLQIPPGTAFSRPSNAAFIFHLAKILPDLSNTHAPQAALEGSMARDAK